MTLRGKNSTSNAPVPATPSNRWRVMVDANVLVAGTAWPRFPYEVLQHAVRGDYLLILSEQIIEEARYSLQKIDPASGEAFEAVLAALDYVCVPSPTEAEIAAHHDLVRDPKDVHVALAAIHAHVDFLITQDTDFTDIDDSTAKLHQLLTILIPGTFLRQYMGWTSEQLEAIRFRRWAEMVY